jgi:hypothetical protein
MTSSPFTTIPQWAGLNVLVLMSMSPGFIKPRFMPELGL